MNCTLCSDGLYLEEKKCLSSCSKGYKPNSTRNCVFCGDKCDEGLTFETNLTYINGEANMFVNFNSDVNINGDLYKTFVV